MIEKSICDIIIKITIFLIAILSLPYFIFEDKNRLKIDTLVVASMILRQKKKKKKSVIGVANTSILFLTSQMVPCLSDVGVLLLHRTAGTEAGRQAGRHQPKKNTDGGERRGSSSTRHVSPGVLSHSSGELLLLPSARSKCGAKMTRNICHD